MTVPSTLLPFEQHRPSSFAVDIAAAVPLAVVTLACNAPWFLVFGGSL